MDRTIPQTLGSFEVIAIVGRGGMGEVYRARDTKLKREVAIKILPEQFSRDPKRVSRFQREAEVLASPIIRILRRYKCGLPAAIKKALSARSPVEWREMAIVDAARVIPVEAERVQVARCGLC